MEEINILLMIGVSLMGGVLIGIICTILLINDNTKELEKEVDKFRELYFSELDKFRNKYTDSEYESY